MRSKPWNCALFVALFGCLVSPACLEGQPSTSAPGIEHSAKQPFAMTFDLYDDHWILVKGTVGSIANVNILIDTGKNPTAISQKLAQQLNLRGNREWLLMSNGKIEVESVTLPHFQIGLLGVESLRVVVQDLSSLGQKLGTNIGAIAGLDILSSTSLMIDYSKRKIVFGQVKLGDKSIPFESQKPFLTGKGQDWGTGTSFARRLRNWGLAGLPQPAAGEIGASLYESGCADLYCRRPDAHQMV